MINKLYLSPSVDVETNNCNGSLRKITFATMFTLEKKLSSGIQRGITLSLKVFLLKIKIVRFFKGQLQVSME